MCQIISTSSFVCNHSFNWTPLVNGSGTSGVKMILILIYTRVWEGYECVSVNCSGSRWCIWILNHRDESQGRAMCLLVELTALSLLLFWINPVLSADSSLSDHLVLEWMMTPVAYLGGVYTILYSLCYDVCQERLAWSPWLLQCWEQSMVHM